MLTTIDYVRIVDAAMCCGRVGVGMMATKSSRLGGKLERIAYELRMHSGSLKAEGHAKEQREFDAIVELMASLGERLNPTAP